jgi:EmrB/QacA subfamily drug resistance transporter
MSAGIHPDCDRALALSARRHDASAAGAPSHPRLVLATTILASSLAFVDGSVVNVGLPAIGRSFGAGGQSLSWIVNGYLLPLSALLLTGGAAGDLFGRRRVLMIGVAVFAAASLLCALAPTLAWLLCGRVVQGVGAAMLMPNSLAILGASFDGEARGRAIGTWAAVGAGAGAVGPLIGGWLIDAVGWRAIFWVNLPIAAAALYLAGRYVDDERNENRPPLDVAGAALATAGLASLTWGLTVSSQRGGSWPLAMAALAAGAALLLVFLAVERRRGEAAMMPLSLFATRTFVGLTVLTFLLYGALGALFVLVPYFLIEVKGYSAIEAGAALLPLPLVIAASSPAMGRIAATAGSRLPLTIGPMIVAAGFLLATRMGSDGSYWTTTLPAMVVIALGMAGAVAPLTTAVLASVAPHHTGVSSGFNSAVARTGGLIATALAASILGADPAALDALFRNAALIGAAAAFAAGLSALVWVSAEQTGV